MAQVVVSTTESRVVATTTDEQVVAQVVGGDQVAVASVVEEGPRGLSAYQVAVAEGFVGTEAEWLASLQGDQGEPGLPRAITVPYPRPGDAFTIFHSQEPVNLAHVRGLVRGDSPSVTVELRYGADRSAAGTLAIAPTSLTNTTTGQEVAIQNMPIPAGRFVWLLVTDVTGTVEEVSMTLAT